MELRRKVTHFCEQVIGASERLEEISEDKRLPNDLSSSLRETIENLKSEYRVIKSWLSENEGIFD